jgi:predicted  nucleic acid-binding Zn-ribbon protein|tara:strand:+ start:37 stop:459 length:423 start_codon:yes stop_codon:yes gene_type:complete
MNNLKVPIAVVGVILVQAFAVIWYMSNLDATVKRLDATVSTSNIERFGIMEAEIEHLKERLTSEGTAEMAKDVGELDIRVSEIEALLLEWSDQNVFHIHDEDFDKKIEQKVTTLRQRIKKLEDNQATIFEEARGIKSKVK